MEPKTGKRIVSKGDYVTAQGKRAGIWTTGAGLMLISGVTGVIGLMSLVLVCFALFYSPNLGFDYSLLALICSPFCFAGASYATFRIGRAGIQHAKHMETGVPLTRANTADLPAPDSLVRASSEPLQAQEAVLLRAATEGQETPPEQLVRASIGQE